MCCSNKQRKDSKMCIIQKQVERVDRNTSNLPNATGLRTKINMRMTNCSTSSELYSSRVNNNEHHKKQTSFTVSPEITSAVTNTTSWYKSQSQNALTLKIILINSWSVKINIPTKQLFLFFSKTWLMLRTLQLENLLLLSLSPEVALAYMI